MVWAYDANCTCFHSVHTPVDHDLILVLTMPSSSNSICIAPPLTASDFDGVILYM